MKIYVLTVCDHNVKENVQDSDDQFVIDWLLTPGGAYKTPELAMKAAELEVHEDIGRFTQDKMEGDEDPPEITPDWKEYKSEHYMFWEFVAEFFERTYRVTECEVTE